MEPEGFRIHAVEDERRSQEPEWCLHSPGLSHPGGFVVAEVGSDDFFFFFSPNLDHALNLGEIFVSPHWEKN